MRKAKQCNPGHREVCKGPSAVRVRSHFMCGHQTHELQTPSRAVCSCCGRRPGAGHGEGPAVEEAGERRGAGHGSTPREPWAGFKLAEGERPGLSSAVPSPALPGKAAAEVVTKTGWEAGREAPGPPSELLSLSVHLCLVTTNILYLGPGFLLLNVEWLLSGLLHPRSRHFYSGC